MSPTALRTGRAVRLESTDDPELWNRLVDASEGATAFHDWGWLDLQADLHGILVERLLVVVDGEPVGVLPIGRPSARSVDSLAMPFPYLGPLVPADLLPATIRALRRHQLGSRLLLARFELPPGAPVGSAPALEAAGVAVREDSTVLVDVRQGSVEALQEGFSSLRRRDIRRAVRDGASVRPAEPGELARLLPEVLHEAFEAHGKPSPYPDEVGARVEAWAAARSDVGIFTALVDGEPAGVQVVLGGHRLALAWAGACLRRFRAANPNVLLYLRLLEWSIEHGYPMVDLCGSVDDGVLRYKLAFGGTVQPYWSAESFLAPAALRSVPGRVRRLVRR